MMPGADSFQIKGMGVPDGNEGGYGAERASNPRRRIQRSRGRDPPGTAGWTPALRSRRDDPQVSAAVERVSCYAAQNFGIPGLTLLIEMRLENYAVIDNLVVEFGPGLNLLTGETGAGKSILVDALALLLGDKASSDVIRAGAERAMVSAVFETEGAAEKPLAGILEANGLDESDDGSLILRRERIGRAAWRG